MNYIKTPSDFNVLEFTCFRQNKTEPLIKSLFQRKSSPMKIQAIPLLSDTISYSHIASMLCLSIRMKTDDSSLLCHRKSIWTIRKDSFKWKRREGMYVWRQQLRSPSHKSGQFLKSSVLFFQKSPTTLTLSIILKTIYLIVITYKISHLLRKKAACSTFLFKDWSDNLMHSSYHPIFVLQPAFQRHIQRQFTKTGNKRRHFLIPGT